MAKLAWSLFTILVSVYLSDAYKILVVFPMSSKSHGILGYGLVKHLLNAGHEVTYITPFIEKNSDPKLRQIDVSKNTDIIPKNALNLNDLINKQIDLVDYRNMIRLMDYVQILTIENENVQKLLNDPTQTFDVVIVEWIFSEVCAGLAALYDAPLIWMSSVEPHWMILRLIDESLSPAYNGDLMSSNIVPFTFRQRVEELWGQMKLTYHMNTDEDEGKKGYERLLAPLIHKKGRVPPSFEDLKFNASIVLGNSHVSLGQATRLPQNYKPIAGYHIDVDVKPLPEKIMDNAKYGVIYFSMGSNLKSKDMPDELKKSFLKMFGGLKQTVLWKFEEDFPDVPKNIHILKWAPQQSILAHPNCVLFITHGGLLSTTETVHFGVPIIGIPVFADQFVNVVRAVNKGIAKRINLSHTMADDLGTAIEEMINNTSYREKVKELSSIYHDRPVPPGVELVHWVNHVARTRGAAHLRSPALRVPWYQKMYLDLSAILFVLQFVVLLVLKLVYSILFPSKINNDKKKKQ